MCLSIYMKTKNYSVVMGTQKFQNVSVVEFSEENCTLFQQVRRCLSFVLTPTWIYMM